VPVRFVEGDRMALAATRRTGPRRSSFRITVVASIGNAFDWKIRKVHVLVAQPISLCALSIAIGEIQAL
jgi:hypothetical protein